MRAWAIPILGAVALSLAVPSATSARPRFGPAALLGAVSAPLGAMLGGSRHSFQHQRRSAAGSSDHQRGDVLTERRTAAIAAPAGPVFWPDASADLIDYLLFPKGNDRFWAYGYGTIVGAAFTASVPGNTRIPRSRRLANSDADAALPQQTDSTLCDSDATNADAPIGRIEQAIRPSASQRETLEQLRAALALAAERIGAACPDATPAALAQRLKAIQDRIWAMRDALLTIRLPLEKFYGSLTDEQHWRLHREQPDARKTAAAPTARRTRPCADPASAETSMRAIARSVRLAQPQRASFEALRLRSAAMAQLIAGSCPTYPLSGHMDRLTAAADRLDVMLFAVMTVGPALQDFYESLDDRQKRSLGRTIRQLERSRGAAGKRA
jgi:hypothetical protein